MKIGIDFDNVLSNTIKTYLDIYNNITSNNYQIEDIINYDISKVLPEKDKEVIESIWLDNLIWENILPLKDSQMYVNMLSKNHDLFIVTSTNPNVVGVKFNWVRKQYPFINESNFIVIKNKQMLDLDILIDDDYRNLINSRYDGILLTYPWNKDFYNEKEHNIKRANNWEEIYNIIESEVVQ